MPDREYIQRLADEQFSGELREAFLGAIEGISDEVKLSEIEARIRRGDVEGAIAAAGVTAAAFEGVRYAIRRSVAAGGRETVKQVALGINYEPGNERAERRTDQIHTELIREVTEETRDAIRDEVRAGIERGENPRETARRIRGTWDRQAGKFRGGTIGLTRHQAEVVRRARDELASGDPEQMRKYLGRKLRDRRHDRSVIKAIREARGLSKEQIDRMEASYRRRWTQHRAETIGRDQSLEALTQGQEEAVDQAIDSGTVSEDLVVKEWVVTRDGREREAHAAIPGMNQGGVPKDEMFDTPYGPLRRPRDRSSPGSVPENTIQCRCSMTYRIRRR